MDYGNLLQENHGKEILLFTRDNHHYQGKLVGCMCRVSPNQCSHLIMLLLDVNYVEIPVEDIAEVRLLEEAGTSNKHVFPRFISG